MSLSAALVFYLLLRTGIHQSRLRALLKCGMGSCPLSFPSLLSSGPTLEAPERPLSSAHARTYPMRHAARPGHQCGQSQWNGSSEAAACVQPHGAPQMPHAPAESRKQPAGPSAHGAIGGGRVAAVGCGGAADAALWLWAWYGGEEDDGRLGRL